MITFFPSDPNVGRAMGAYNDALVRGDVSRTQADADIQRAQIAAEAQRRALQDQHQQNQFLNALRQQELAQQGAYQQGTLANQRDASHAQMDWAHASSVDNYANSEADRKNRLEIARLGMERYQPSASDIQSQNNISSAHADRLNFELKNLADAQAAEEKKAQDEYSANIGWSSPFTFDSTISKKRDSNLDSIRAKYRAQVNQLAAQVPKDAPVSFDQTTMRFVPKLITQPSGAASGSQFFGGSVPTIPQTGGFQGGVSLNPAPAAPATSGFFGSGSAVGGGAGSVQPDDKLVTVRSSSGKIGQMKASDFVKARQLDPGAQLYTPGQPAVAPVVNPSVPPPAETVNPQVGNTPGTTQVDPSAVGLDRLRKVLSGPNGTIDIGKNPFMNSIGWGLRDVPAIRAAIQAAESGQPVKDMFGGMTQLSPQQIAEAKQILSTFP